MRRAAFLCMALAMAVTASPLGAQQTTPDAPATPAQPAPPPASDLPPPVPKSATELPPPFPHYPARAPREHDPNYRRSSHRQSASHHHTATRHHATAHHATTRHKNRSHHQKASHHAGRQYFSKKTIRQCHGMTYKQIMRHKNCRTMMKQDLQTTAKRPAKRHASSHRRTSAHKAHYRRR